MLCQITNLHSSMVLLQAMIVNQWNSCCHKENQTLYF